MERSNPSEVLFEFVELGRYVKVTALDPISRVEVAIVGDRNYKRDMLKRAALNKLLYVLNRGEDPPDGE